MEIVGIDRLAYEPDRHNQFVSSRHSGIGEHCLGGARFVACNWCRVFRLSSAPKANCRPRRPFVFRFAAGYSRCLRLFLASLRHWTSYLPPRRPHRMRLRNRRGIRWSCVWVKGREQIPLWATALSTRLLSLTWPCISICRCMDKPGRASTKLLPTRNGKSHLTRGW